MRLEATVNGRRLGVEVTGKDGRYNVLVGERRLEVDCLAADRHYVSLLIGERSYELGLLPNADGCLVSFPEGSVQVQLQPAARGGAPVVRKPAGGPARLTAPMPGKIVRVLAVAGQEVVAGQGLLVMEAMKMENELRAPRPGHVREIHVAEGQAVETGALLALLD